MEVEVEGVLDERPPCDEDDIRETRSIAGRIEVSRGVEGDMMPKGGGCS